MFTFVDSSKIENKSYESIHNIRHDPISNRVLDRERMNF